MRPPGHEVPGTEATRCLTVFSQIELSVRPTARRSFPSGSSMSNITAAAPDYQRSYARQSCTMFLFCVAGYFERSLCVIGWFWPPFWSCKLPSHRKSTVSSKSRAPADKSHQHGAYVRGQSFPDGDRHFARQFRQAGPAPRSQSPHQRPAWSHGGAGPKWPPELAYDLLARKDEETRVSAQFSRNPQNFSLSSTQALLGAPGVKNVALCAGALPG